METVANVNQNASLSMKIKQYSVFISRGEDESGREQALECIAIYQFQDDGYII